VKDLLSAIPHPEKLNDPVPAFPMRNRSMVHSGENSKEIGRTDGVIRDSGSSIHQINVKC
jgi:hypothetical protein